ncbi:glycerate kinase [Pseudarthrobacter sp. TAF60_1]|uniref:glycerate kinase n=1 Tax=Pseudarthrobacter sp. TAF60_1 TaxID=3233071 RepID=UPI003F953E5E
MPLSLHILIAPDKFKGCLTAAEVSAAIRAGIESASGARNIHVSELPLADGGDGSVEGAELAGFSSRTLTVHDGDGQPRQTRIAYDGMTAVVEVAATCGLATLRDGLRPLQASSRGLGEAIRAAATLQPGRLVVALGGSASTDGGTGMLAALGAEFRDDQGNIIDPCGGDLGRIADIDLTNLLDLSGIELVGASDVTNPLTGPDGAAQVFGPQKGATSEMVGTLDEGLVNFVETLQRVPGSTAAELAEQPGAGSAGGIGFGVLLLGGTLVSGADYFLDLLNFDAHVAAADLLITGEGRLDAQTVDGKLISAVCRRAKQTPVWAVVGCSDLQASDAHALGLEHTVALTDITSQDTTHDPVGAAQVLKQIGRNIVQALGDPTPHAQTPAAAS